MIKKPRLMFMVSHEKNIQHKLVRRQLARWAMDCSGKHEETLHMRRNSQSLSELSKLMSLLL